MFRIDNNSVKKINGFQYIWYLRKVDTEKYKLANLTCKLLPRYLRKCKM